MSRTIQVHQVDAFTRVKFTGNPAGVVLEADALSDSEMLAIARELNNADTAFVFKADGTDHDLRIRFFTPRTEAAFVGHASVAAHYVLSSGSGAPRRLRQKSRGGIVEVDIRGADAERRIAIRQSAPPLGREISDRERLAVLDALALASSDLDVRCPVRVVGTSSTRLMVGVRAAEQLRQLKPDVSRLTTLSAQLGAQGFFVFTLAPEVPEVLTESRMFCPALGIAEDPVSGNAHGMLGIYLARLGLLGPAAARVNFAGAQGHHLNRPGRVEVELDFQAETVAGVWIVGQAVAIFATQISL
ncbi:MAG TPA: PhzF family phenazine biosynthesis isomerase [Steroidobacteraceae bacterium]|jgi:PhzF family phenazine biosynthesis protein